jgi:hypothetical protein
LLTALCPWMVGGYRSQVRRPQLLMLTWIEWRAKHTDPNLHMVLLGPCELGRWLLIVYRRRLLTVYRRRLLTVYRSRFTSCVQGTFADCVQGGKQNMSDSHLHEVLPGNFSSEMPTRAAMVVSSRDYNPAQSTTLWGNIQAFGEEKRCLRGQQPIKS